MMAVFMVAAIALLQLDMTAVIKERDVQSLFDLP
jgi:hypothetical protein